MQGDVVPPQPKGAHRWVRVRLAHEPAVAREVDLLPGKNAVLRQEAGCPHGGVGDPVSRDAQGLFPGMSVHPVIGGSAGAAEELRIAHGRVRRVVRTGQDSLTASERRVALLPADGRGNREIAAELFLSVRTVGMHLSHAFRKLYVASRRNLSEALTGVRGLPASHG